MDNLIRRTLTGIFIVIFVLGGFWLHPFTFIATALVLLSGSQYEYYSIIKTTGVRPQWITGMISGIILYTTAVLVAAGLAGPSWFLIMIPVVIYIMIAELYRKQERPFDSIAHTIFPLAYLAVPFSMFPFSAFSHSGLDSLMGHGNIVFSPGIVVGFFILLWVNDSGAYLVGVSIGRHRLMERISPRKSWEGFAGGLVFTVVAAFFLSGWLGVVGRTGWIIIALIISITGTLGDLVESMLKRSTGVKDSGNIMPGHGGFLDRFDSTFVSFPLVFLYITLFG
ncbi:MAG TPA: phosphatidate cytidylyltransferase [Bacteroidales bacterium]|nr:phosphatidate cytidylyltransferase [Bacteroidales bacterium]